MEKETIIQPDIRTFYMLSGQIIFAEMVGIDDNDDFLLKGPVMSILAGQGNKIGMSVAFPFSSIDDTFLIHWRHVTTHTSLKWNTHLMNEYDNFWKKVRAQQSGIEIVPAGGGPIVGAPGPGPHPRR